MRRRAIRHGRSPRFRDWMNASPSHAGMDAQYGDALRALEVTRACLACASRDATVQPLRRSLDG
jgi:hypothetical protein